MTWTGTGNKCESVRGDTQRKRRGERGGQIQIQMGSGISPPTHPPPPLTCSCNLPPSVSIRCPGDPRSLHSHITHQPMTEYHEDKNSHFYFHTFTLNSLTFSQQLSTCKSINLTADLSTDCVKAVKTKMNCFLSVQKKIDFRAAVYNYFNFQLICWLSFNLIESLFSLKDVRKWWKWCQKPREFQL